MTEPKLDLIIAALRLLVGSGVYLQLQNEDGTTSGLVGVLDRLDDGLAVVKSKGRTYPVFTADIRNVRPRPGATP